MWKASKVNFQSCNVIGITACFGCPMHMTGVLRSLCFCGDYFVILLYIHHVIYI